MYGPEPELNIQNFGPINGVSNGDGCRVGVYTREERTKRIERFREKKLKRIWRKQIKYDCRKRLADTRPRVKGRFVSRAVEDVVLGEAAEAAAAETTVTESDDLAAAVPPFPKKARGGRKGGAEGVAGEGHSHGDTTEEDAGDNSECSTSEGHAAAAAAASDPAAVPATDPDTDPAAVPAAAADGAADEPAVTSAAAAATTPGGTAVKRQRQDSLGVIMDLLDRA